MTLSVHDLKPVSRYAYAAWHCNMELFSHTGTSDSVGWEGWNIFAE